MKLIGLKETFKGRAWQFSIPPPLCGMRYFIGFLVGVLLLGTGYSAYWVWLAQGVEAGIERWIADNRSRGYVVDHGSMDVGGFPFSVDATISAPHIGRPGHPLAWDWRGEVLRFESVPWRPNRLELDFAGRHNLSYLRDGERHSASAVAHSGQAELIFSITGLANFDARLSGIEVLTGESPTPLMIQRLSLSGRPDSANGEDKLEISADAKDITLPPETAGPMGPRLALLRLTGTVRGRLPETLAKESVARWRDDGGVIDVHQLLLDWGNLASMSRGAVSLDEAMRPVGSLTSQISGFRAVVDALVKTGRVEAQNASTIKAVLGLLARADSAGREVLSVAVTAQNGRLAIGPVPVLTLSPIF